MTASLTNYRDLTLLRITIIFLYITKTQQTFRKKENENKENNKHLCSSKILHYITITVKGHSSEWPLFFLAFFILHKKKRQIYILVALTHGL